MHNPRTLRGSVFAVATLICVLALPASYAAPAGNLFVAEVPIAERTKQGKQKWVWEQGCIVCSAEDDFDALEGIIIDITEQKQVEEALQESKDMYVRLPTWYGLSPELD